MKLSKHIQQYYTKLAQLQRVGSTHEQSIRAAFQRLLEEICQQKELTLVAELRYKDKNIIPDGTIRDNYQQDWGYWESKDSEDDIDKAIQDKFEKGYPKDNILFENSLVAVLIQQGKEILRCEMQEEKALAELLLAFINFERPEIKDFRKAIEVFKENVPKVADSLRQMMAEQQQVNPTFVQARDSFLTLCKKNIGQEMNTTNVREMIVQHILTEDLFVSIFDDNQFHRENNIAHELEKVLATFFFGKQKRQLLKNIGFYYNAVKAKAASVQNFTEKQELLKVVYEEFYKAYNPKGADRLGIVYTPMPIVKFMIESADYLLDKHFNTGMAEPNVEILDPATGTGTFISQILQFIPPHKLKYKYQNEIHCNEISILPYYIANLNIEYTYDQIMNDYEPFENMIWTDTLLNSNHYVKGEQIGMFGVTPENTERIKKQNKRKISLIIGNPPYNATQQNENEANPNKKYPKVDSRIRTTYAKESNAQNKNKIYDMYARFMRWASDRIEEEGMIAFITNSSFINSLTFDGFRKCVQKEFDFAYIIDLGGDVRANPKLSGTKHNVFGIQTGIAVSFLVKEKVRREKANVYYLNRPEFETRVDKLDFLSFNKIHQLSFDKIYPDKQNNWINLVDNDFDTLLAVADKDTKSGKEEKAIFKTFSLGIKTARDEWLFDFSKKNLSKKIRFFNKVYNQEVKKHKGKDADKIIKALDFSIKWSSQLRKNAVRGLTATYRKKHFIQSLYRPFVTKQLYNQPLFIERSYQFPIIFPNETPNKNTIICFSGISSSKPFQTLAVNQTTSLDVLEKTQCLPLYYFNKQGRKIENITNWGVTQFQTHYQDKTITKQAIFHYVYSVFHNPNYSTKYKINLQRNLPRVPFYTDFWQWSKWGEALVNLHVNFENVAPYPLSIIESEKLKEFPKVKLKADKENGLLILDENTNLGNIPLKAWSYKLGNRSALEWVLDQYKEKKIKDKTIDNQFNTYRFTDYKEEVIKLLKKVCTVSLETMEIVEKMKTSSHEIK